MNKSVKKALALAVMLAALIAIYIGAGYVSNYEREVNTYTPFMHETILVKPMGYGYIRIDINESGDHEIHLTMNGTLRTDSLHEEEYLAWVNGLYKPLFRTEVNTADTGDYFTPYVANELPWYNVYWNTNSSASVEVELEIHSVATKIAYNYFDFGLGTFLITTGAISVLLSAYSICKRVLLLVVALALVASGAILLMEYTQKATFNETVALKTIVVPANGNFTERIHYNATGAYNLICKVDRGIMNATTMTKEDYLGFIQGQGSQYWQAWRFEHSLSGMSFYHGLEGENYEFRLETYLVLVNSDEYDKDVTVQFERYWEGYNYAGLLGSVTALAGGIILGWYANRRHITAFNRALDNE